MRTDCIRIEFYTRLSRHALLYISGGAKLRGTAAQIRHFGPPLRAIFAKCINKKLRVHRLIELRLSDIASSYDISVLVNSLSPLLLMLFVTAGS